MNTLPKFVLALLASSLFVPLRAEDPNMTIQQFAEELEELHELYKRDPNSEATKEKWEHAQLGFDIFSYIFQAPGENWAAPSRLHLALSDCRGLIR